MGAYNQDYSLHTTDNLKVCGIFPSGVETQLSLSSLPKPFSLVGVVVWCSPCRIGAFQTACIILDYFEHLYEGMNDIEPTLEKRLKMALDE